MSDLNQFHADLPQEQYEQGFTPTDAERAANRKAVMALSKKERFETLLGHPKTIMNETDTPTPTPRIDKLLHQLRHQYKLDDKGFKQIEIELTAAREELAKMRGRTEHQWLLKVAAKLATAGCKSDGVIEALDELTEDLNQLKEWKESATSVEKEWDVQAVGKLLGISLGKSICVNIEPKIRELIKHRDRLAEALKSALLRCNHGHDDTQEHCFCSECVDDREALQSLATETPKGE